VPRASLNDLRMSSVVLVGKAEQVTEAKEVSAGNPLYTGNLLFYPSGGEPFSRAADRQLTAFYTIYPGAGFGTPDVHLELQRNGRSITTVPVALGPRDGQGRIQQVSRIPLAPLSAGTYELRIHVRDAKTTLARSTFFQVKD
jgi:hypothetical protein